MAQEYIEALIASLRDDGYFGPAYLKTYATIEGDSILDLYPVMLLLDTLIMYYEVSGDERIPKLIERFFDFCIAIPDRAFIPITENRLKWQRIRAGEMLSPLYWYYEFSHEEKIIALAQRFYRAIYRPASEYVVVHAVDFAHRFSYDVIYSKLSGKPSHFDKSEYLYSSFQSIWGQMPRGIFAADEQIPLGCARLRMSCLPVVTTDGSADIYHETPADIPPENRPRKYAVQYRD